MAVEHMSPCPRCGSAVTMSVESEGGHGESRLYAVTCNCGLIEDGFPSNCSGRRRDAERQWNRWAKRESAKRSNATHGGEHE